MLEIVIIKCEETKLKIISGGPSELPWPSAASAGTGKPAVQIYQPRGTRVGELKFGVSRGDRGSRSGLPVHTALEPQRTEGLARGARKVCITWNICAGLVPPAEPWSFPDPLPACLGERVTTSLLSEWNISAPGFQQELLELVKGTPLLENAMVRLQSCWLQGASDVPKMKRACTSLLSAMQVIHRHSDVMCWSAGSHRASVRSTAQYLCQTQSRGLVSEQQFQRTE